MSLRKIEGEGKIQCLLSPTPCQTKISSLTGLCQQVVWGALDFWWWRVRWRKKKLEKVYTLRYVLCFSKFLVCEMEENVVCSNVMESDKDVCLQLFSQISKCRKSNASESQKAVSDVGLSSVAAVFVINHSCLNIMISDSELNRYKT